MFCRACGTSIAAGGTACTYCGSSIAQTTSATSPAQRAVFAENGTTRSFHVPLALAALAALALLRIAHAVLIRTGIAGPLASRIIFLNFLSALVIPLIVLTTLAIVLGLRRSWGRYAALMLGALRFLSTGVGYFGFRMGGGTLGTLVTVLELGALAVGGYALLAPGARAAFR